MLINGTHFKFLGKLRTRFYITLLFPLAHARDAAKSFHAVKSSWAAENMKRRSLDRPPPQKKKKKKKKNNNNKKQQKKNKKTTTPKPMQAVWTRCTSMRTSCNTATVALGETPLQ